MKSFKPAIATADIKLIKKAITFYLNKNTLDENENTQLMNIFHRLGRLDETVR